VKQTGVILIYSQYIALQELQSNRVGIVRSDKGKRYKFSSRRFSSRTVLIRSSLESPEEAVGRERNVINLQLCVQPDLARTCCHRHVA
jgi:hypothetical protein